MRCSNAREFDDSEADDADCLQDLRQWQIRDDGTGDGRESSASCAWDYWLPERSLAVNAAVDAVARGKFGCRENEVALLHVTMNIFEVVDVDELSAVASILTSEGFAARRYVVPLPNERSCLECGCALFSSKSLTPTPRGRVIPIYVAHFQNLFVS